MESPEVDPRELVFMIGELFIEKRILEEKNVMLQSENARMAADIRNQGVEGGSIGDDT